MRPYSPVDVELTRLIFEHQKRIVLVEDYPIWLALLRQRDYFWLFWVWRKLGYAVVDSPI